MFEILCYTKEQFEEFKVLLNNLNISYTTESHSRNCECNKEFLLVCDFDQVAQILGAVMILKQATI